MYLPKHTSAHIHSTHRFSAARIVACGPIPSPSGDKRFFFGMLCYEYGAHSRKCINHPSSLTPNLFARPYIFFRTHLWKPSSRVPPVKRARRKKGISTRCEAYKNTSDSLTLQMPSTYARTVLRAPGRCCFEDVRLTDVHRSSFSVRTCSGRR